MAAAPFIDRNKPPHPLVAPCPLVNCLKQIGRVDSAVVVVAVAVSPTLRMRRFNFSCTFLDRQLLPGKSARLPPSPAAPVSPRFFFFAPHSAAAVCFLFIKSTAIRPTAEGWTDRRRWASILDLLGLSAVCGLVKTPVGDTCGPVTGID